MAAFKQFNTNEVVLTPFYANKDFYFRGSDMTASNVGIEIYQSMQGPYVSGSFPTGFTTRLDQVLVFNNINKGTIVHSFSLQQIRSWNVVCIRMHTRHRMPVQLYA